MTKLARLTKVREVLSHYQGNLSQEPELTPQDLKEFCEAVRWDFYAVKCLKNPTYPTQQNFINVQIAKDDPWTTFSWTGAIKGTRGGDNIHGVRNAMRTAVQPQAYAYANSVETLICSLCGSEDNPSVDHVGNAFHDISSQFLEEHGMPELVNANDGIGWVFKDKHLEDRWIEHHKQNASFRILCRSCNSKLGKDSK